MFGFHLSFSKQLSYNSVVSAVRVAVRKIFNAYTSKFPEPKKMQSLPKFIFYLLSLILAVASEDDDFDWWAFRRQQGAQEFVNGSHSISGAAFTPESPVVLVKAVKTIWTYIPFPPLPRLDTKPLNSILEDALRWLTALDLRMFSKEGADAQLFTYGKQLLEDN